MNATVLESVLAGVVLAAIVWAAKSLSKYGNQLTRIETILTGADGSNGLNGEVRVLRERSHKHSNEINALKGNHALLSQRVDVLEGQSS